MLNVGSYHIIYHIYGPQVPISCKLPLIQSDLPNKYVYILIYVCLYVYIICTTTIAWGKSKDAGQGTFIGGQNCKFEGKTRKIAYLGEGRRGAGPPCAPRLWPSGAKVTTS